MSRIGKKIIIIPAGVEVKIQGQEISVKGPKGTLNLSVHPEAKVEINGQEVSVKSVGNSQEASALWGLTRSLVQNMVTGVTEGYAKKLELQGVGFRMAVQGKKINMALGFSHPVVIDIPEGIEAKIDAEGFLVISGIDKQQVGQFTADIRDFKQAEPYKGKGFRYVGEYVRRKAGKKAAATTTK
ncbi:MAG: 50S ribosomal protein L6 [Candidatus Moranbacteria bacterium]|nr:50S ribosomal protein L6 [Candidatus Moranbacteria bacterium]